MSSSYTVELLDRPGVVHTISEPALRELQGSLCKLGRLCFNPLPNYQVFSTNISEAFQDKILVLARNNNEVIGFVSAVMIPNTSTMTSHVIHTGLTVIHPHHQRSSGVIQLLFGNLFLHLLNEFPRGVWTTTVAEVISSLVHMSKYTTTVYPSPEWEAQHPGRGPDIIHVAIAREIISRRQLMLIASDAKFDEKSFVIMGSCNTPDGQPFVKDVDDPRHWHRDSQASGFYRKLFRKGMGDEVLQVGFLDPEHMKRVVMEDRFKKDWGDKYSKI